MARPELRANLPLLVDSLLGKALKAGSFSGVVVARHGVVALRRSYGVLETPATPATQVQPMPYDFACLVYLASAAVPQTPGAVTMCSIIKQKYIAMFLNPGLWSGLRRFDFDFTSMSISYILPAS
jgi:hypothetical protein